MERKQEAFNRSLTSTPTNPRPVLITPPPSGAENDKRAIFVGGIRNHDITAVTLHMAFHRAGAIVRSIVRLDATGRECGSLAFLYLTDAISRVWSGLCVVP